jgi:aspartyl protease family protein
VTLIRSANGHFEARGIANDLPVSFLVDTGASHVVFTYEDARKIGLRPERLAYDWPVSTANGRTTNAKSEVAVLQVGGIERRNLTVFVAQQGALDQSLLGMSFLSTLGALEYRGDRMVLTD